MAEEDCITKHKCGTKEYHAQKSREWYHRQTEEEKKERNKGRSVSRNKNKMIAIDSLGGKCSDCGIVYPHYVYDFHHIDQDLKSAELGRLLNCAISVVMEEIKNCVLLCANCHRIRHAGMHNRKARSQLEIYGIK